jgi:hypothetical protein
MKTTFETLNVILLLHDMLVKMGWYCTKEVGTDDSTRYDYTVSRHYPNLNRAIIYTVWVKIDRHGLFSFCTLWGTKYNAVTKVFTEGQNLGEWSTVEGAIKGLKPRFEKHHKELLAK